MNHKKYLKYPTFFITLIYFLINLFFMRSFWSELIFDRTKNGAIYGEVFALEWGFETLYKNILSFKNPFSHSFDLLYPFGTNLLASDSGSGFFFIFLRPFLSVNQSFYVTIALGLLAANIGMYLLLRKLKFNRLVSFLIGLSFGYTTFLMPRVGHITYFNIYVFPWFYYFAISIFEKKSMSLKFLSSIGTAFFLVLSFYLNLYLFIMIFTSVGLFFVYYILFERAVFISKLKLNWKYLMFALLIFIFFLFPWLIILLDTLKFEGLPKVSGWGGAIQFSSDLFGYFIPSVYSYFLHPVGDVIGKNFTFASAIFENFSYPGILIIFSYFALFFLWRKKKINKKHFKFLNPFLFTAFSFWMLTLGPFLHVFGKWGLKVDDGIRIVVPLPYVIFHYLPFMNNIRVPGRLVIAFIFFSYFIAAYIISYIFKSNKKYKLFIFSLILLIIIIDQYFVIHKPSPDFYPRKAYELIKNNNGSFSTMEIPSTVRDGFIYYGDGENINFMLGQQMHKKPVLGGYFGRVAPYKLNYYIRNPFWGYIGRLIDPDLENNGGLDKNDLANWQKINISRSVDSIDFLDLKYILLNNQKDYSSTLSGTLKDLGFKERMQDNNFVLYQREPSTREFLSVNVGGLDDDKNLGIGWGARDKGFRWSGERVSVLLKLNNPRDMILQFESASFYKKQDVTIYINKNKIAKVELKTNIENFKIPVEKQNFKNGINTIQFILKNTYRPIDVMLNSSDDRNLAAKFTKVSLKDSND